jgi:glycosyltransferase involved in cell wall biosynthesis
MSEGSTIVPLVSVIIPCYNQGRFLAQSINSVLEQDYARKEIIVVNDGSWDNTATVAQSFEDVIYIQQPNAGLSAARNRGLQQCKADYVLMLDADDLLLPGCISTQVDAIQKNRELAFVSGGHIKTDAALNELSRESSPVERDHFLHLLRGNYIGMHAAVLFRRSIFDEFSYDTALKAVEDYDLYLEIARKYPVAHHTVPLTVYRQHGDNMSSNIAMMLETVLGVLKKHYPSLKGNEELNAYKEGVRNWTNYYCDEMFRQLRRFNRNKGFPFKNDYKKALWKFKRGLYIRFYLQRKYPFLSKHL